ncbi:rhamnogalacturonan acetylesterase [Gracilibacillus dipsosauri]|nr:rhamnogalacturonan acetylesterase [Gracilibacillus dipsosauri]
MVDGKRRKLSMIVLFSIIFVFSIGIITVNSSSSNKKREENQTWIYIAGDSTASNYTEERAPRTGWGQVLDPLFDKKIEVINKAASGRSSKSFIAEGRLDEILSEIQKGDYLFIQFGHNDAKEDKPSLYTDPSTTYKSYLKQYIDGAREQGALPILLTPVERRTFSEDGTFIPSHGDYPKAMKELAQEENVPVLHMTEKTTELYNQLGPEESKDLFMWLEEDESPNYSEGVQDSTHFRKTGATEIAQLVVEEIERLKLKGLYSHLN